MLQQTNISPIKESINKTLNNLDYKINKISEELVHKNKIYELYPNFDEDYYKAKKEWEYDIQKALSLGHITQKEAEKLGWYGAIGDAKIEPLPEILYHVTTNKDAVIKYGLKTRNELNIESGHGLGGGASDTVSFTESLTTANNIKDTLIEAQKVASGKTDINDILNYAKLGIDADRPFYNEIVAPYIINRGDYFINLSNGKITDYSVGLYTEEDYNKYMEKNDRTTGWKPTGKGFIDGDNQLRYNKWIRDLSEDEIIERTFNVYKKCLFWREHAGGKEDPLFFLSDVKALSKINPEQITVLKFRPKPNAHGYQMGALGEWRTFSGEAVELIKEYK